MFHAARRWWRKGDGRRVIRLFVFEFVVVMAGVLAAQGLQGWVAERSDAAEGRALLGRASLDVAGFDRVINYWHQRGPCLQEHVGRIARAAASGATMTATEIGRPALPSSDTIEWNDEQREKVALIADADRIIAIENLKSYADTTSLFSGDIGNEWATFRLLDPSLGEPSALDRARVRQAAVVIDNRLRWLQFARQPVELTHQTSGVPTDTGLPESARLADACGLLLNWR